MLFVVLFVVLFVACYVILFVCCFLHIVGCPLLDVWSLLRSVCVCCIWFVNCRVHRLLFVVVCCHVVV